MKMLAGFVKFMAENGQTRPEKLKVMRYTVCRTERRQGQQETCLEAKGACFTLKHRETGDVSNETGEPSIREDTGHSKPFTSNGFCIACTLGPTLAYIQRRPLLPEAFAMRQIAFFVMPLTVARNESRFSC